MSSRKRKHRTNSHLPYNQSHFNTSTLTVEDGNSNHESVLYIQAYEADINHGPEAATSALSLEAPIPISNDTKALSLKRGSALIKWNHDTGVQPWFPEDQDEDFQGPSSKPPTQAKDDCEAIWVDRYDARLLLDVPPGISAPALSQPLPDSPGGWSDLPSDNEDVFFLSPEEVEDFRRDKKRRHLEDAREERLKARRAEDGDSDGDEGEVWGGSDEEPDETQQGLMRRTAVHLLSSPNSAQLEMRILANHGTDTRFAFLRGRWSRAWRVFKVKAKQEKAKEDEHTDLKPAVLGGLAGYGDSDEDEADNQSDESGQAEGAAAEGKPPEPHPEISQTLETPLALDADDAAKEARRARAKEWTEKRRLLRLEDKPS